MRVLEMSMEIKDDELKTLIDPPRRGLFETLKSFKLESFESDEGRSPDRLLEDRIS